jgi:hypothetical protein
LQLLSNLHGIDAQGKIASNGSMKDGLEALELAQSIVADAADVLAQLIGDG